MDNVDWSWNNYNHANSLQQTYAASIMTISDSEEAFLHLDRLGVFLTFFVSGQTLKKKSSIDFWRTVEELLLSLTLIERLIPNSFLICVFIPIGSCSFWSFDFTFFFVLGLRHPQREELTNIGEATSVACCVLVLGVLDSGVTILELLIVCTTFLVLLSQFAHFIFDHLVLGSGKWHLIC